MPTKAWSVKKRVITRIILSLLILVVALIIGTVVYGFGRGVGIFQSQNLTTLITQELAKDPKTLNRFYQSLYQEVCLNQELGYQFNLYPKLRLTPPTKPENACTELTLTNPQGETSYLKIIGYPKPVSQSMNAFLAKLDHVNTSTFNHPLYNATLIEGTQNNTPLISIFIAPNKVSSWNILFYPANPVDFPLIAKLAKSFKLTDN